MQTGVARTSKSGPMIKDTPTIRIMRIIKNALTIKDTPTTRLANRGKQNVLRDSISLQTPMEKRCASETNKLNRNLAAGLRLR
jgi:hypothetical protein